MPMESANSGLSIGTKITFMRKLSVMFADDPKIPTDFFFQEIRIYGNGVCDNAVHLSIDTNA